MFEDKSGSFSDTFHDMFERVFSEQRLDRRMREDRHSGSVGNEDGRVQGAYDYCDGESAFIIADVTTDDAWVAIQRGKAASVEAYR